ncbi:sugar phosphate isomerase [Mycena maculata]|uniref:Sugar phosphate isomerase n=1 Tax=Mycena maculata TaxID=230809 RepID=A0AAD7NYF0_9AGAR|nr:sugar phosphate isomerase [Mycena maculata]
MLMESDAPGRAWVHDLDVKLREAGRAGYKGIEVFWEDLVYAAKKISPAAQYARALCDENGLAVVVLQPFVNYEGLLDRAAHDALAVKLKLWFKVVKVLGSDLIQVPSQMNSEGTTGNIAKIVSDMKELAELGLNETPPVRFAYEALSWGAHLDLWEQVWDVVAQVDLPNFRTVVDTYHILARVYGDPTSSSGIQPGGEAALSAKLIYVQLSDAACLAPPLSAAHPYHDAAQKPTMQRRAGGTCPSTPSRGSCCGTWASAAGSRTMGNPGPDTPRAHAERGIKSWETLLRRLQG